ECSSTAPLHGRPPRTYVSNVQRGNFFDMSGPRAEFAYGRMHNICVAMEPTEGVSDEDWDEVLRAASLRVCDRLAETTRDLDPPSYEILDTTRRDPALPSVVYVPMLISLESFRGPRTCMGPAVYGLTRQSMPWSLYATEVIDGAITRGGVAGETW